MIYRFENRMEDYLDALALEKANARQNRALLHLILLLVIGCLVYLNLSTLRMSFRREDTIAYGSALAVMAVLLVGYSPKIIPSLLFPIRERLNLLAPNTLGPREFEMNDRFLGFRYGGTEIRVGYRGLARVNHNDHTVLFYLQSGVVEPVPLRALGVNTEERMETLERIQANAIKASRKAPVELSPWLKAPVGSFSCGVTEKDILACGGFDAGVRRKARLRSFSVWLSLAIIFLCCLGGGYGLLHLSLLPEALLVYLKVFYMLEIPGCLIALLYWFRPAPMIIWGIRQNLKLGLYPMGYLGTRWVEWNRNSLSFRYGVYGMCVDWDCVSRISDDGHNLYFYQNDTLLLFLPKAGLTTAFREWIIDRSQIENLS